MEAVYFCDSASFRRWLEDNHQTETQILVGFYKKGSGHPSISWAESVDEALCYGWIDGVRKRVDDSRYTIRFTPRKSGSIWSDRNIKRVEALVAENLMTPAGLQAFENRTEEKSRIYSFEQEAIAFDPDFERQFRAETAAWEFFTSQAPWYQRAATWWVMSARRQSTRERRLDQLIADSSAGQTIRSLTRSRA